MSISYNHDAEWLEPDGLGGFASGTVGGRRTRRYHALLLTATTPPTGRFVLVNGCDVSIETPAGRFDLSSQSYSPGIVAPDGERRLIAFAPEPWPRWTFALEDGSRVEQELFVLHGTAAVALCWRRIGSGPATLAIRPFLSGRDYHALHHENPAFRFEPAVTGSSVAWRPYPGVPGVVAFSNGNYHHEPQWYRRFLYTEEQARGLDDTEDLAAPGVFRWDLARGDAVLLLSADGVPGTLWTSEPAQACLERLRAAERSRRASFPTRLHRAADAYLVQRGSGKTIVAGYPWFTDWGRDTFISLRGLCLATGRYEDAAAILLEWAGTVSEGMVPNRFLDLGDRPEFNAVDASLWFVIAVDAYLRSATVSKEVAQRLHAAVLAILTGYARGTRHGIRADADGLLAAGEPGLQLTWMDAKVGDWVVTPRIGKPVEVQALWLNALAIGGCLAPEWTALYQRGLRSFRERFWNAAGGCLYDVVDVGHVPGAVDPSFRPNQVLAVGGLPLCLLEAEQAADVVAAVEERLWTPLGLRSLAPGEPNYQPRCTGGVRARDGAYHQGTVWPWLIGPFVEAWLRTHGHTVEAKREARQRFLEPLLRHLDEAGIGHASEIADGDAPHTPRGCPFQAWSVGEVLRLDRAL